MNEDYDGLLLVETHEDLNKHEPGNKRGCMTVVAAMLAFILVFSASFPLLRFIIRNNYDQQVENFKVSVCENLSDAGFNDMTCDPSLGIAEFVPKVFSIGDSEGRVAAVMKGYSLKKQIAASQPGCLNPSLLTYLVAKSFIGWKTEVAFLFCSDLLVERTVLVDGAPIRRPTYDF